MKAGILFSGGKDSSLAAVMLSRDYEVELNTFVFDAQRGITSVEHAAESLGLPLIKRVFQKGLMEEIIAMIIKCGFVNDAINMVHRSALHVMAEIYEVVGDGTRLQDRVPMLTKSETQSLADRYGCSYVRPLLGFGKREVQRLSDRYFVVLYGESGEIMNGDYEGEIRQALHEQGCSVPDLFPPFHQQSLVVGKKERDFS